MDISEVFSKEPSAIISYLKSGVKNIPSWDDLIKDYEPSLHKIVNDKQSRVDKIHSDGSIDKAARLSFGLEKLLVNRFTEFTFAIPVKRIYTNTDTQVRKDIAAAMEQIFISNHINNENIERGKAYYGACEIFTLWYTKKEQNSLYGFDSTYKLKCKTFSPMNGTTIYPLFDEKDDLIALSFEYQKREQDSMYTYFEAFTSTKHYVWKNSDKNSWTEVSRDDEIEIGKIPASYLCRKAPVFDGLSPIREEIEYSLSRNSDVIAYNSAPVLMVSGTLVGEEKRGETRRIYRVENGGNVAYVSWQQSIEALKYHVDTLVKLFFMQSQMPDISFENLKSLGNIGYDARKTLLADAHLKIGDESGAWVEFFERETNVVKAFLKKMNTRWANEIDQVKVEHVITPFIQEDEKSEIEKWKNASGGKALVSQMEAIKLANLTDDPDKTYEYIQQEEQQEADRALSLNNMFSAE